MRIISNFRDYYDGVQSLGIDSSLVYVRMKKVFDLRDENYKWIDFSKIKIDLIHNKLTRLWNAKDYYFKLIGFCGKLYLVFGSAGNYHTSSDSFHRYLKDQVEKYPNDIQYERMLEGFETSKSSRNQYTYLDR